jgi:hypothetical protein
MELSERVIGTMRDASRALTGPKRRRFQAEVCLQYLDGSATRAERVFGWSRHTVKLGLNELRTGIECLDAFSLRGNRRTEDKCPQLEQDIRSLVDGHSQADPQFRSTLAWTRLTGEAVREALIQEKGWTDEELPSVRTLRDILNRLGYRLRRVQKTKPKKKIPETDAIFENVHRCNAQADDDEQTLRISMDVKAKVKVGEFSRGGESRGADAVQAQDHDMGCEGTLVPLGILDVAGGPLTVVMGTSKETADFLADGLLTWWDQSKDRYAHVRKLVINLDCGPENSGQRTQFLNRMVQFADQTGLEVHLVYYPPYHSKYNPVERCWAALENHWNGTLLDTVDTVVNWAATMTWKGTRPIVHLLDRIYQSGVTLTKKAMQPIQQRLTRKPELPKWDIKIQPYPTQ